MFLSICPSAAVWTDSEPVGYSSWSWFPQVYIPAFWQKRRPVRRQGKKPGVRDLAQSYPRFLTPSTGKGHSAVS